MAWLEQIVTALLKWLQGMAQADTVANESKPDPDLRADLLRRIDEHEQRVRDQGSPGPARDAGEVGGAGKGPDLCP